eukprot:TRINITY_DN2493_c0_g2_i3.p1 TRINITY_DN2493_c0_g2~~TRINITY_DN2493_c0_g2_i3.p1  ORF type:complete len:566 (-),score=127.18 TRINITY_DN2493_c0_g2_i3:447-2144(-)
MTTLIAFVHEKQRIASRIKLDPSPSLAHLITIASHLFSFSAGSFTLAYEDEDQDIVPLRLDEDVREAILSFHHRSIPPILFVCTNKAHAKRPSTKCDKMKKGEVHQFLEDLFKFNHYDIRKVSKSMQTALRSGDKRQQIHHLVQLFCSSVDRLANGQVVAWLDEMVEQSSTQPHINRDSQPFAQSISQFTMLGDQEEIAEETELTHPEISSPPPTSGFISPSLAHADRLSFLKHSLSIKETQGHNTELSLTESLGESTDNPSQAQPSTKVDEDSDKTGDEEFQLVDGFKISILPHSEFAICGSIGDATSLSLEWRNVGQAITSGMHIQVKRLSGVIGSPTIVFSPESLSFDSEGIGRGQKSAFVLPFQLPRVSGTSHARFQVMLDMGSSLRHEWIPISDPFTVKCTASEPQPLPSIQAESQVMLQEEEVNDPISIAADSTSEYQQVANGLDQCQIAISLISNEGQSGSSSIIESSSIDSAGPSQYSSGSSGAPLSRLIECKKPVSSQSNISTLSEPQVAQMGDFQVEAEYTPNSLQTTSESSVLFLTGEQNSMVSSEVMVRFIFL